MEKKTVSTMTDKLSVKSSADFLRSLSPRIACSSKRRIDALAMLAHTPKASSWDGLRRTPLLRRRSNSLRLPKVSQSEAFLSLSLLWRPK